MGWFWAEETVSAPLSPRRPRATSRDSTPPPGCPMHQSSPPAKKTSPPASDETSNSQSACPYNPPNAATTPSATQNSSPPATIAALNPLNYMPSDLAQTRESTFQTVDLPTSREISSIPRASGDPSEGNWVYPSPQQMYNAMLRKGHTDTPQDAVESMVAVHNFLNEGAWAEIVEWERRFGSGLAHGWRESRFGEEGSQTGAMILPGPDDAAVQQPRLMRFMGRSDAITPKARMLQVMGWLYPSRFEGPPPFDRHDWFVQRQFGREKPQEIRYVIDYYSAPPEPTGEPVFYLDIRPALDRPGAAAERLIRWGRDVWWRASGASERLKNDMSARNRFV